MITRLKMAEDKLLEVIAYLEGSEGHARDKEKLDIADRIAFIRKALRDVRGGSDGGLVEVIKSVRNEEDLLREEITLLKAENKELREEILQLRNGVYEEK